MILTVALPVEERAAGGVDHLQRARDALAVAGQKLRGHGRVARREFGVEIAREAAPFGADLVGNFGNGGEAVFERAKIKPGAARDDGQAGPRAHAASISRRASAEPGGDRIGLVRRHMAIEPVRRERLLLRRRAAPMRMRQRRIDLQRIGIDDDAVPLRAPASAPARTCRWRWGLR